jgi:hypothetical protein
MVDFGDTSINHSFGALCSVRGCIQRRSTSFLVVFNKNGLHIVSYEFWRWIIYFCFEKQGKNLGFKTDEFSKIHKFLKKKSATTYPLPHPWCMGRRNNKLPFRVPSEDNLEVHSNWRHSSGFVESCNVISKLKNPNRRVIQTGIKRT